MNLMGANARVTPLSEDLRMLIVKDGRLAYAFPPPADDEPSALTFATWKHIGGPVRTTHERRGRRPRKEAA
jgi:hypothetical protein